jgi:DNA-binding NarL/FixJ family response regulator
MRVVIADDAMLMREGTARLLEDAGFEVVGRVDDADKLIRTVAVERPDVAIVDIKMPPTYTDEGLRLAAGIRSHHPETGVLVLSQYLVASYAALLLERSPERVGYLLKDNVLQAEVLEGAMRRIAGGGTFVDPVLVAGMVSADASLAILSDREREVLGLMAEGLSDRGIAERLTVGLQTVYTHVQHVFAKLELPATSSDNRRVRAVVAYLASRQA